MNDINPKYQQLINHAEEILQPHEAATLANKVKRWEEHAEIRDEYFSRPGEVKMEDKVQELAEKYHYSASNIHKILYAK